MTKKSKITTPDWILKGKEKSKEKKKQVKTFKIRKCPKCKSDNVNVVLTGEEGKGTKEWECKKCKWKGKNIDEEELTEEEFMKYLDSKGVDVA
ncbi:MAG: hypothetical protein NTU63_00870 [Candidatus Pacearchaeota archaeon]|nr:hypothetical protein [Candidatus Pacearchaeota archaeon]